MRYILAGASLERTTETRRFRFFSRYWDWWLLFPILALGTLLRFDALPQRGLLYWDEGKFALEGVRLVSILHSLPHLHPAVLAGKAVGTAKPTHALLIALTYSVLGIHDYAPLLLDAGASVLQIALVFLLARQLFGSRVAVLGALLLAVSGYDVVYARSALSESDANVLLLLGVLLWWRGRSSDRPGASLRGYAPCLYAGAVLGAAFTTNYRLIVYIAILVGMDLLLIWRRAGWWQTMLSGLAWTAGLALLPLLWQGVGAIAQAHGIVLFRSEITYRPSSYAAEMLYQLHGGRQSALQFSPLPYLQWYVIRQGWLASLFLLAGFIVAARQRPFRLLTCAAFAVIPYVIYAFAPFIVPRNLDPILPFTAIVSAVGLVTLVDLTRSVRSATRVLVPVALLAACAGTMRAWPLSDIRSGYAQAANYVEQRPGHGALAVNEVMRFYLRDSGLGCDAPRLPATVSALAAADQGGNEYAVIDKYARWLARYLSRHARIVARYPAALSSGLGENLIASENGTPPISQPGDHIDVYSLDSLHLHPHPAVKVPGCTLDQLA